MEKGLHERDLVGLQDFVLLEDYHSEQAFIDNLKKRFQSDLIYVSIFKTKTNGTSNRTAKCTEDIILTERGRWKVAGLSINNVTIICRANK